MGTAMTTGAQGDKVDDGVVVLVVVDVVNVQRSGLVAIPLLAAILTRLPVSCPNLFSQRIAERLRVADVETRAALSTQMDAILAEHSPVPTPDQACRFRHRVATRRTRYSDRVVARVVAAAHRSGLPYPLHTAGRLAEVMFEFTGVPNRGLEATAAVVACLLNPLRRLKFPLVQRNHPSLSPATVELGERFAAAACAWDQRIRPAGFVSSKEGQQSLCSGEPSQRSSTSACTTGNNGVHADHFTTLPNKRQAQLAACWLYRRKGAFAACQPNSTP